MGTGGGQDSGAIWKAANTWSNLLYYMPHILNRHHSQYNEKYLSYVDRAHSEEWGAECVNGRFGVQEQKTRAKPRARRDNEVANTLSKNKAVSANE